MTILQRSSKDSGRHLHSYRTTPAIAGFARKVCSDCSHVSIDSPDASIPNAATSRKTGLFGSPAPRLGVRSEELLPTASRTKKFGMKAEPA